MNRQQFYKSDKWENFRKVIIAERTTEDGYVHCSKCGKAIVNKYDTVLHHIKELSDDTVADATIALNPDNIEILCFRCHNTIHNRFVSGHSASYKTQTKKVFIVYGSPLAGKTSFVRSIADPDDLIVDMDSIYEMISVNDRYTKPDSLNTPAFAVRDALYDCIKFRSGKWKNAYVINSGQLKGDRERLKQRLGADELVYIESTKEECFERLKDRCMSDDQMNQWKMYINHWFETFQPDA